MKNIKNNFFSILLIAVLALSPALAGGFYPGPQPGGGSGGGSSTPTATTGTGETLEAAANSMTYTVSSYVSEFTVPFNVVSNAGSNTVFMTFNDDTAQTNYTIDESFTNSTNMAYYGASNASPLFESDLDDEEVGLGFITVHRRYDGSNTIITARFQTKSEAGLAIGIIERSLSGDVALSAVNVYSDQSSGLDTGSSIG